MFTVYYLGPKQSHKIYIGQTKHTYHKRCQQHIRLSASGKSWNPHLANAVNKYGASNITSGSLAFAATREHINELEHFLIDYLNTTNPLVGYNITQGAGFSGLPKSEEFKNKLKERMMGNSLGKLNRGKRKGRMSDDGRFARSNFKFTFVHRDGRAITDIGVRTIVEYTELSQASVYALANNPNRVIKGWHCTSKEKK